MRSHALLPILLAASSLLACVADATDTPMPSSTSAQALAVDPVAFGTWKLHLVDDQYAKCLDVGGYPSGNGALAIVFTCNGTPAQDLTIVPSNDAQTEVEIRAHGRCLSVQGTIAKGAPLVLDRCDGSRRQQFVATSESVKFASADAPSLFVTTANASGADRTPLVLADRTTVRAVQLFRKEKVDTTPYVAMTPSLAQGTVELIGLANKCLDIGGAPYPARRPSILFECNATGAQRFTVSPVEGKRGEVEIHANGRCLEVAPLHEVPLPLPSSSDGLSSLPVAAAPTATTLKTSSLTALPFPGTTPTTPYFAGAEVALTECAGRETQRFGIETFDATYVFPAKHPELAVGVRGAATANWTPIELQARSVAPSHQWKMIGREGPGFAPVLPKVSFGFATESGSKTVPALFLKDQALTESSYSFLYRPLGTSPFTERWVSGGLAGASESRFITPPFAPGFNYEVKVRVSGPGGIAESAPFMVDARPPSPAHGLSVSDVTKDAFTISWTGRGSPYVDVFAVVWRADGDYEDSVAVLPAIGAGETTYSRRISGLDSGRAYTAFIRSFSFGGQVNSDEDVYPTTLSSGGGTGGGGGDQLSSITMSRQEIVEGNIPYVGKFGPIAGGATVTRINFPTQYPAVKLLKPGHSTNECGNASAYVLVQGDMTDAQKKDVWGTSSLTLSSSQWLLFLGCSTNSGPNILEWLPVNVYWHK